MPADARTLSVADALSLSPLDQGRLVAGRGGLARQLVRWVAVIEWPVEDFVAPGELVLTTGVGCDPRQFERLVAEVADAGAAALCVGAGPGAPLRGVPRSVVALGDRLDFPIVQLPWAVRFADVLRAVVDRLMSARYAAAASDAEAMPSGLTAALLRRDGLEAVAQAAEEMLDRPVIILDAAFSPLTAGKRASERLAISDLADRAAALNPDATQQLQTRFAAADAVVVADIPQLGLPSTLVASAQAQERPLGYVLAVGEGRDANALGIEQQALRHTAVATTIELLRRQAAAAAESRVHGDFLWELAAGSLGPQEIAAKATLLGYSLHHAYRVLLARAEPPAGEQTLEAVVVRAHRRGAPEGVRASYRGEHALVLVPQAASALPAPAMLARRIAEQLAPAVVSWGISHGTVKLADLADGVQRARRSLEIGRALRGPGVVADPDELELYLLLGGLAADAESRRAAEMLLEPLVDYDRRRSRELTRTLEVFLQENGNTSSAARRLFLNRHSLIYRLRKIEELTGRDLANHEDRFALEISLRIRRLADATQFAA